MDFKEKKTFNGITTPIRVVPCPGPCSVSLRRPFASSAWELIKVDLSPVTGAAFSLQRSRRGFPRMAGVRTAPGCGCVKGVRDEPRDVPLPPSLLK